MSYAHIANRPNPLAALGALGVPAAFGAILIVGLAVKATIEKEEERLTGLTIEIPEIEEEIVEPVETPVTQSDPLPQPVETYTPPPRPDTDYTLGTSTSDPIGTLVGPGETVGPIERAEVPIPRPTPRFDPVSAAPRGNPGNWITDNDYRTSWITRGFSGVASFTLAIDASGRVTGCTITGSTGYTALDEATCRLLERRARFEPARDASGNTVAGSYRSSVRWNLPE